jgi:hypothetical protein
VPRDLPRAAYLFGQAGEGGNALAQLMLARMYLFGEGVTQDPAKAYYWALLGAVQKPDLAAWYFDKLRGTLSVSEMDRVRVQSRNWYPKG